MNLDTLFQQIELTEKKAGEKRRLIQQGQPHGRHLACPTASGAVNGRSIFQGIPTKVEWHHCKIKRGVLLEKLFRQTFRDFLPMPLLCKQNVYKLTTNLLTGFPCFAVKFDINKYHEKTNQLKEELNTAKIKLETKVQQLSEKMFFLEILKKREDSLEKQKAELINQKSILLKNLTDAKRKMAEEEDNFTREVTEFNDEYGLTSNRELLIKKKVKTEINDLENEAAVLKNEMETMEHENVHLNALQLQKNELKQELFTFKSELKDLEKLIKEAEGTMKDLEAEKVQVTEKPQTNPECLRLKKELENYKDDDWESIYETLRTEVEILQMKLSQKKSTDK
ncbi:LOW QUALITY PROTEIN: coiled-coil domain-containing protein 172 [Phasianus colchicus]|uniref:LOW QUALITY PROTEIN: coiled-coil domain-containing protein 172 n=1 Tax=Phasianus colchicus TaxID=9054 RepID=UPI00129DE198|nr:LOW QUALITY PROTEIN: coiled-coil domain-containing protein 172 [Phasianus colchicus]